MKSWFLMGFVVGCVGGWVLGDEVYDMGSIVIEGSALSKYRTDTVSTSTFFDVAPEVLPVSLDVMTEDFIREQDPDDLHDLLYHQPGVSGGGKSLMDRTSGQYQIRGKAGSTPSLDGTLPLTPALGIFLDPNALERIEIAKGPVGAIQGGQTSALGAYGAGGSINLITKQPQFETPFLRFGTRLSGGEDTQKIRFNGDWNELITDDLAIRVPLSMDTARSFWLPQHHRSRESFFMAPALKWEVSETFRMGFSSLFQWVDAPGYQGVPSYRGKPLAPYQWDSYLPGRHDLRDTFLGWSLSGYSEWDASDAVQFRIGIGYAGSDTQFEHLSASQYANQRGEPEVRAFDFDWSDQQGDVYNLYGRSLVRFETADFAHTLVFQGDITKTQTRGESGAAILTTVADVPNRPNAREVHSNLSRMGALLQDYIEVDDFRFLAGVRYDSHESNLRNHGDAVSPRVGLSWVPDKKLTLFANLSQTAAPNFGFMKNEREELTTAWRANQWETGVRYNPFETCWVSLAYYEIRQQETPEQDDATGFYVTEGESENRGIEFSVVGNLLENWSFYCGYTFNDRVERAGERSFDAQPPQSLTLRSQYCFQKGVFSDMAVGIGYRYRAGYDGTMRGNYVSEDYTFDTVHVMDLSLDIPLSKWGGREGWVFELGVKNLFDTRYFASNRHYYQCFPGEPRIFEVGLRGQF